MCAWHGRVAKVFIPLKRPVLTWLEQGCAESSVWLSLGHCTERKCTCTVERDSGFLMQCVKDANLQRQHRQVERNLVFWLQLPFHEGLRKSPGGEVEKTLRPLQHPWCRRYNLQGWSSSVFLSQLNPGCRWLEPLCSKDADCSSRILAGWGWQKKKKESFQNESARLQAESRQFKTLWHLNM